MEIETNQKSVVENVSPDLLKEIFAAATNTEASVENVQTVKEEVQEIKENQVVVEEALKQTKNISNYSQKIKELISDGILENFSITYEDQEVFLEDIEDLNEEGYKEILKGWKSAQDEEIKSKYISIDGLDETTKKLIEIRKSGGDISEVIKENVTAIDQLSQLKQNIDDEKIQINIVAYALQEQGIKPKVIQAQIQELIEEGHLETEAKTILDSHLKVHEEAIEQKRQAQIERVEKEKEDLKNLRKTLSTEYKELGLPEGMQKVLVDNATKPDQNRITNTDKLYFEAIQDPKKFAMINFFLNNPDEFTKYISSSAVTKAVSKTIAPALKINITKTNKPKLSGDSLQDFVQEAVKNNNPK